jgi:hypothetical protein
LALVTIRMVNAAWRGFGEDNGAGTQRGDVRRSHLEICECSGSDADATRARRVAGAHARFTVLARRRPTPASAGMGLAGQARAGPAPGGRSTATIRAMPDAVPDRPRLSALTAVAARHPRQATTHTAYGDCSTWG